jgi:hypothetical protein
MTLDPTAPAGMVRLTTPFSPENDAPAGVTTAPSLTTICTEAERPSLVAVMIAVPTLTPVIRPEAETVARVWSELDHVTGRFRTSPDAARRVAVNEMVAAGTSVAVSGDRRIDATVGVLLTGPSPPQLNTITAEATNARLAHARLGFIVYYQHRRSHHFAWLVIKSDGPHPRPPNDAMAAGSVNREQLYSDDSRWIHTTKAVKPGFVFRLSRVGWQKGQ